MPWYQVGMRSLIVVAGTRTHQGDCQAQAVLVSITQVEEHLELDAVLFGKATLSKKLAMTDKLFDGHDVVLKAVNVTSQVGHVFLDCIWTAHVLLFRFDVPGTDVILLSVRGSMLKLTKHSRETSD